MAQKQWTNSCCNPFNNPRHKKSSLRPVLPWMCEKISTVTLEQKICDSCRKKLAEMETEVEEIYNDDTFHYQNLESINKGLSIIGESPVIKSKLQGAHYSKEKLKSAFMKSMLMLEVGDDDSEMIKQLKEKFHESEEKSVKVQVLTVIDTTSDELEHQKD